MISILELDDILETYFKDPLTAFEEPSQKMKIEIDKRGSQSVMYSFDKQLNSQFKGGLFPFFSKTKGVCSMCDYIIFAIKDKKLYALVVELKKGLGSTKAQLNAAECFVNYIVCTICRIKKQDIKCEIRKISVKNPKIRKKKTKMTIPSYDEDNHTFLESKKFYLSTYLK